MGGFGDMRTLMMRTVSTYVCTYAYTTIWWTLYVSSVSRLDQNCPGSLCPTLNKFHVNKNHAYTKQRGGGELGEEASIYTLSC